MSFYHHLLDTRTKEDLARLLVDTAKENAALRDEAGRLRHELFWLKVDQETHTTDLLHEAPLARADFSKWGIDKSVQNCNEAQKETAWLIFVSGWLAGKGREPLKRDKP